MEREKGQFEADTDDEKAKGAENRSRVVDLWQPFGKVIHVECAGHHVHKADADENESRADGAHDEILV